MKYEGNPKHKEPWQIGRKGSLCPKHLTLAKVQELLDKSIEHENQRFATYEGRAYKALKHGEGFYHGYPVGFREVPEKIRMNWLKEGKVNHSQIMKFWNGGEQ